LIDYDRFMALILEEKLRNNVRLDRQRR